MLKNRYSTAAQLDGVIDIERLHSGPTDSIERDAERFSNLLFLRKKCTRSFVR